MPRTPLLTSLLLVFLASPVVAEKNATVAPQVVKLESATVVEDFASELSKEFSPAKGEWKVVDGSLIGKELAADEHAAVLSLDKPNRNSVVRFSFKLDGETEGLNFSMNHARGHLFRVVVTPEKLTLSLDKDKKDPESKSQALATGKGEFAQGQWYTMQVEMVGNRVVAQTDNGIILEATHEKLDTDKPNYRWVMRGDSLSLDDLQVWEVK
jgi:hypothetical protein